MKAIPVRMLLVYLAPYRHVQIEQLPGIQPRGEIRQSQTDFLLVGRQFVEDGGWESKGCLLAMHHEFELQLVEPPLVDG